MYNKLIYELKLLSDRFENTSQSKYVERVHNLLITDSPLEEVVEELVQALLSIDPSEVNVDNESYEEGWNDAMAQVETVIHYR